MPRIEQVNELLRSELANLIVRQLPSDNYLITVTDVKCSADLRSAKIAISVLPDKFSGRAIIKLKRHSGGFSQILKKKLKIRHIPKFNWLIDYREKRAAEIEKIVEQIKKSQI